MRKMTRVEELVFKLGERDHEDKDTIIGAVLAVGYEGLEAEVSQYLDQHPDATFQEVFRFMLDILPTIEIVDDE